MSLEKQLIELQEQAQVLAADNIRCQDEVCFLVQQHRTAVSQLKEAKDGNALLNTWLRKLTRSVCAELDLNNLSALTAAGAIGSTMEQLVHQCNSLHNKESLNISTTEALMVEKAVAEGFLWLSEAISNSI